MSKPTSCELCKETLTECFCFAEACDCPYNATGTFRLQIQAAIREAKREAWESGLYTGNSVGSANKCASIIQILGLGLNNAQDIMSVPNPYAKEATDE